MLNDRGRRGFHGFAGGSEVSPGDPWWSAFVRMTLPGYVVAVVISLYLLWIFARTDGLPPEGIVMATVVLAFPSAIGAAAARLILCRACDGQGKGFRTETAMAKHESKGEGGDRPPIEWLVGAISAALVAGLLLYLGHQVLFGESRAAALGVSIERVASDGDATTVTVAVVNRGDKAAAAVTVLAIGPGAAASRQIEFGYVAAGAMRRGAFVFPGAVNPDEVGVELGGYTEP